MFSLTKIFHIRKNFSRIFFLLCLLGISIANGSILWQELIRIHNYKKVLEYDIVGYQFGGLDQFLKDVEVMGYYTGNNLEDKADVKLFSHAQFVLAPIILDLNNLEHEYILFVCKDKSHALKKISEIKAMPLRGNQYGMILVKRDL